MVLSSLASRCLKAGDPAAAASFANEAYANAPPMEETSLFPPTKIRNVVIRPSHKELRESQCLRYPPSAWALTTAIGVSMTLNDTKRLRVAAADLEDFRDRSLFAGSLDADPYIREQIDKVYDLLKTQYPDFWPAPKSFAPIAQVQAEANPSLLAVKKISSKKRVEKEKESRYVTNVYTDWEVLLETKEQDVINQSASTNPEWLIYRLGDEQLRAVGRAYAKERSKNSQDERELKAYRLASGKIWDIMDNKDFAEEARNPEIVATSLCLTRTSGT
jgi:hypothetical protein